MARAADLTKTRAAIVVETVLGSIVKALRRGEKTELRGFGSFRLRRRGPHLARNPRTGDRVGVPPKRVPYFEPGNELNAMINLEPAQAGPLPLSE